MEVHSASLLHCAALQCISQASLFCPSVCCVMRNAKWAAPRTQEYFELTLAASRMCSAFNSHTYTQCVIAHISVFACLHFMCRICLSPWTLQCRRPFPFSNFDLHFFFSTRISKFELFFQHSHIDIAECSCAPQIRCTNRIIPHWDWSCKFLYRLFQMQTDGAHGLQNSWCLFKFSAVTWLVSFKLHTHTHFK